jgi:hypothetical protein
LLMTQDRVGSQKLGATQESIARLLGVRRSSVTAAASGLHKQNVIAYSRGRIEILDQGRLSSACGSRKREYVDSIAYFWAMNNPWIHGSVNPIRARDAHFVCPNAPLAAAGDCGSTSPTFDVPEKREAGAHRIV